MITRQESKEIMMIKGTDKDPVRSQVRKYQHLPAEKWANFIEAGEGNYAKTEENGKYRHSCMTLQVFPSPLKKCDSCGEVKKILSHCGKIDCSACFTWSSYERTERIVQKHEALEDQAKKTLIKIGKPTHFVFSPRKNLALFVVINKKGKEKLDRKFSELLETIGLHSSTILFHLRSIKCKNCKKELKKCNCSESERDLYKALNPHFHVFGYGFVDNIKTFKKNNPKWNYFHEGNLETKEDLFRAIFYALSKSSIWRKKEDGKLLKSYRYSGFLLKGLKKIKEESKLIADTCQCKGKFHYMEKGYEIKGDKPHVDTSITVFEKARVLGIGIKGKTEKEVMDLINKKVKVNKNIEIKIWNDKIKLGRVVYYRRKIIKYKLVNVRQLRRKVKECKEKYLLQKRGIEIENLLEGNGYG